eukprot:756846-Hanusia_phi.AAC.2
MSVAADLAAQNLISVRSKGKRIQVTVVEKEEVVVVVVVVVVVGRRGGGGVGRRGSGMERSRKDEEQKWNWDALSTMRFALWALVCTPIIDSWLTQLDRVFGGGSNMIVVAQKLLLDQIFFGPCFLTLFFTFVGLYDFVTQGKDLKFLNFKKLIIEQVIPTHRNGMMFWLPVRIPYLAYPRLSQFSQLVST